MKMYKVLLILLFIAIPAKADTIIKYSVNAGNNTASVKGLSVGTTSRLFFAETKLEGGIIYDVRPGASSSGFLSASIGVEPHAGPVYVNFFQGLGLITATDAYLGGLFQFFIDAGAGIEDESNGVKLGAHYKHVSSAGIYTPNKGKDMVGLQISVPF